MATQSLNTFREDIFWGNPQSNPETAITATTYYPASGSFFDVAGFRRFAFLVHAGALNSTLTLQVRQDTSATVTAGVKDITGATVAIDATTGDTQQFSIEVNTSQLDTANGYHYVSLYVTGASGSDDYAAIFYIAYGATNSPVTQTSNYPAANAVAVLA